MPHRVEGEYCRNRFAILMLSMVVLVGVAARTMAVEATDRSGRESVQVVHSDETGIVFSSWRESGRLWTSVSFDGGEIWSEPRAKIDEISLAAGVIVPGETAPAIPKGLAAGDDLRVFIVQFETRSLPHWRRHLGDLGAEVLGYLPHDAHLVRMDPRLANRIEALPFVRWVGPYEPSYRTFPEVLTDLEAPSAVTRRYNLMTFKPGAAEKSLLAAEVEALGARVEVAHPPGYIVEASLTNAQALALLASNHLQWIDVWGAPEVDMDNGRVVAGADYVEATPGGYDGTGVRAEVFDTFVDTDHPDFPNPVPIHGPVDPDSTSHGTSCYGINFASGAGNAATRGMVPGAYGYFAYYLPVFYGGVSRYDHTAELVDPSLEYQCVYQSNSVGSPRTFDYTAISAEMDDIIWQSDFTIFQSQSNSGTQDSRPQAWAKNIISVGGARHLNNTDPLDDYWSGASIGPAADGRIKPDLTFFYDSISTTGDGSSGYTTSFGGTSGATPMTAGTSGLLFQMWQDNVWGTAPGDGTVFEERPHFTTMKALMINTAKQYDWTTTNPTLTRVRQGWGYPSAQNAYDRAAKTVVLDETSVLEVMQKDSFTATVPAMQDALKVTMVYADRAGNPAALPHRVNDVTLRVVAPDGTEYWGNSGLTDGIWSTPGGSADTINTVENVFVQNPAAGDWTIEVEAVEVNLDVHVETPGIDDQDYALVVYGVSSLSSPGIFADGFESGSTDGWSWAGQ